MYLTSTIAKVQSGKKQIYERLEDISINKVKSLSTKMGFDPIEAPYVWNDICRLS